MCPVNTHTLRHLTKWLNAESCDFCCTSASRPHDEMFNDRYATAAGSQSTTSRLLIFRHHKHSSGLRHAYRVVCKAVPHSFLFHTLMTKQQSLHQNTWGQAFTVWRRWSGTIFTWLNSYNIKLFYIFSACCRPTSTAGRRHNVFSLLLTLTPSVARIKSWSRTEEQSPAVRISGLRHLLYFMPDDKQWLGVDASHPC